MEWLVMTEEVRMAGAGRSRSVYQVECVAAVRAITVKAETMPIAPARTKFAPATSRRDMSADSLRMMEFARTYEICIAASAIAERRIQRRQACWSAAESSFA